MNLIQKTVLGALVATLAAPVALAEGRQIEEVIVTAERQEASIQDTSISITAFTGDFIDDFGIRNQEDLQNFVPATTIQPYDATVRGVGRNFRALGGDPGVATYMNGVYSEDLLTATGQTFWDVERIEVLRGPQGILKAETLWVVRLTSCTKSPLMCSRARSKPFTVISAPKSTMARFLDRFAMISWVASPSAIAIAAA